MVEVLIDGRVPGVTCWWRCFARLMAEHYGACSGLGGMQFGVLVEVLFCESWPGAKGIQFGVLVEGLFCESVCLFCESDGRVLGGMQFRVLVEVLFCEIDGRVPDVVRGAGAGLRA